MGAGRGFETRRRQSPALGHCCVNFLAETRRLTWWHVEEELAGTADGWVGGGDRGIDEDPRVSRLRGLLERDACCGWYREGRSLSKNSVSWE